MVRACLYDPDINVVYAAFAEHWGFTPLPTRPRHPQENGKQERSGGYVKDNALKGRRFDSLEEQNAHLRRWNRTIARLRIHGTTRCQVWTHFLETDKPALGSLAPQPFAMFTCGERIVHPDGHIEVDGAFYPVPSQLLGRQVQIRRDARLLRVYHRDQIQAVHLVVAPGRFAPRQGEAAPETSSQRAFTYKLLGRCRRVGEELHAWAEQAVEERGVRALRLIQGAITLTRKHPREAVLRAARIALDHRLFRYRDLRRLTEQKDVPPAPRNLLQEHPSIRPIAHYRLEDFL